jgi:hypothetical protein
MLIKVQKRAEIALHSLRELDRDSILKIFIKLEILPFKEIKKLGLLHKIKLETDKPLFLIRAGKKFRIVVSLGEQEEVTIEDIVPHSRLDRLLSGRK